MENTLKVMLSADGWNCGFMTLFPRRMPLITAAELARARRYIRWWDDPMLFSSRCWLRPKASPD